MNKNYQKLNFTWVFILIILSSACSKKEAIVVSGSSTVLPVIAKAAESFRESNPNIRLIVNAGGSGLGINQLAEGKIQIGMASRSITNSEIKKYPKVNFNPIPIGKDAVVAVVSSEIYDAGITALSLEQMKSIFSGEVDNWSQFGGPDRKILFVDKEASRGTRHVFMEKVMGNKEAQAAGADLVLGSNNEEQTAIIQSDAAIGMLSHAWLNKDVKGLAILMPDSSLIQPNLENILNNKYPITRDLLIITNGNPTGDSKNFIDFILSEAGQAFVTESGYVSIQQ